MITGATTISKYRDLNNKKRVDFILKNYGSIGEYIKSYEEILCDDILGQRAIERRIDRGETGVRVQTSEKSDPTAMAAVDRVTLEESFSLKDNSDRFMCRDAVLNRDARTLKIMKRDFKYVIHAMNMLSQHDRCILGEVLRHEKTLDAIAEEKGIQYESAKMYIYRSRLKVRNQALEFIESACAC
jgi:hypothetical protein